jgi:predicted nucleic acid-binding protein
VIEFWAVATRPSNANGLGLSVSHVIAEVARFEKMFRVVQEPPGLFRQWRQLAETHAVKGKQVHDARLAAIMIEAGIDHILTFNADDFRRYPGITAVTPDNLTVPTPPEPSRTPE